MNSSCMTEYSDKLVMQTGALSFSFNSELVYPTMELIRNHEKEDSRRKNYKSLFNSLSIGIL